MDMINMLEHYEFWMQGYRPDQGIRAHVGKMLKRLESSPNNLDACLEQLYALDTRPFALEGAHELVTAFVNSSANLTIWTQGDPAYQLVKLDTFFTPEEREGFSVIASSDKAQALVELLPRLEQQHIVIIDDKTRYLRSAQEAFTNCATAGKLSTIRSIATKLPADLDWRPDAQVCSPQELLDRRAEFDFAFTSGASIFLDFDRTLFDPDRFVREAIIPKIVAFANERG